MQIESLILFIKRDRKCAGDRKGRPYKRIALGGRVKTLPYGHYCRGLPFYAWKSLISGSSSNLRI